MASKYDKQIKQATTPTKPSVNTSYTAGAYAKQNATVAKNTQNQISNATNSAETAYKMATANNEKRASEVEASNNTLTRQIGNGMRKRNFSLTNRNIASAASARSASANASALASANQSAKSTRYTAVSQAKVSALKQNATLQASNTQKDIERSTQKAVTKAQQKFQSSEAKKNRQLKNAISKKQKAYDKTQRQLSSYSKTLEARYTSIKAVDKAIKKMKGSDDKQKSQKLAYLRALRAKLQEEKKKKASGGRGGRGRRGYGGRGWGGYGSSKSNVPNPNGNGDGKDNTENVTSKDFNLTRMYQFVNGKKAGEKANGVEQVYAQRQINAMNIQKDSRKIAANRKKWKSKAKSQSASVRWRGSTARKK